MADLGPLSASAVAPSARILSMRCPDSRLYAFMLKRKAEPMAFMPIERADSLPASASKWSNGEQRCERLMSVSQTYAR